MRRLLRDVAEGRPVGDTTTLADTTVMSIITERLSGAAPAED
jgi:acetyl-CoA synthetase